MAGYAAGNIVDFISGFGERKRAGKVRGAMMNYLDNPEETVRSVNAIDPYAAMELNDRRRKDVMADTTMKAAQTDRQAAALQRVTGYLRGLPEGTDYGSAIDGMVPFLKGGLGATDQDIMGWKQAITANPAIINALDDDINKARATAQYGSKTLTPGSALYIGGKKVGEQPFAPKFLNVRRGDGGNDVVRLDPNDPGQGYIDTPQAAAGAPGAGGGITMDVEALRPHFLAQESGGDYGARNTETGALGAYQVMPATAQTLAKRLGLAWRPDMMQGKDPASMRYQDAIGGAAIKEAIDASGGDPAVAAMYYHGGSDRKGWGPRTQKYRDEMLTRFGGQPASRATPPGAGAVYSTPGKPASAAKTVRNATPQEIAAAGYPEGTAAQIDANGKFVNMKTPAAGKGTATFKQSIKDRDNYLQAQDRVAATMDGLQEYEDAVTDIMQTPDLASYVGSIQGRMPSILSGGRQDFNNRVFTLKTKVGLAALQSMRDMSKTGGALGQVSNYENKMLQTSIASLETSNSEEEFTANLNKVLTNIRRARKRLGDTFARMPNGQAQTAAPAGAPSPAVGTIARNPQTGARVRWNGQGWEPVR